MSTETSRGFVANAPYLALWLLVGAASVMGILVGVDFDTELLWRVHFSVVSGFAFGLWFLLSGLVLIAYTEEFHV